MAKLGLRCYTEAHSLAYSPLLVHVCQATDIKKKKKKASREDNEFVPEDKKSHLQSYRCETEQGQASGKSQEVCPRHCP